MEISRRRFLESSAIAAAASAAPGFATIACASNTTTGTTTTDVIARLALSDAVYLVGSVFLVSTSSGNVKLQCVEVKAVGPQASPPDPNQAFAMRFSSQGTKALKEGTYTFQNSVLGQFRLFIATSGPGVTPLSYTAIINHQLS
jgi:hypothetical protein